MKLKAAALSGLSLFVSPLIFANSVLPTWTRTSPYTTYQGWDVFSSATGPNAPNSPGASGAVVDAAPFNPNGTANLFDTSGQSFIISDGNIYSFSAPTHINITLPEYGLGSGYDTTVLLQTRTQGNEPIFADGGGYKLTYSDGSGSHAISPIDTTVLADQSLGGFGGDLVDYAAVYQIPGSPSEFTINVDASDVSMSFDRASVDTIVTRATGDAPLETGMSPTIGFTAVSSPEPATALLGFAAIGLVAKRSRRRP